MSWRTLRAVTAVFAIVAAAGAGAVFGVLVLGDGPGSGIRTPAEGEPLRKAPLLAPARPAAEEGQAVEAEEARPVQLAFPEPGGFRPGSPERALAEFMAAWRDRRFGAMQTWTAADSGPDATRESLRRRYGPFRLRGWRIERRRPGDAPGTYDFALQIDYRTLLEPRLRRAPLDLRLARRAAAGQPAGQAGSWGVDPLPRLRPSP